MSLSTEIRVPRETVNDDLVTIAAWHRTHGERVREKDVVVSIETSKAVLEVEAERDGFLEIIYKAGAEVPIGELIGHIRAEAVGSNGQAAGPARPSASTTSTTSSGTGVPPVPTPSTPSTSSSSPSTPAYRPSAAGAVETGLPQSADGAVGISKKAQRLIEQYQIDPAVFAGKGLVREADVIKHLESRQAAVAAPQAAPPTGTTAASDASPARAPAAGSYRTTGLFGDASRAAGSRGKSLPWVVWNYFWRNWLLGNMVRIAPRGVINVLHKWRGVKMGRDCFIDPSATLETAYPELITMGHDVRVTVGAIVMCHIKAPLYLQDTGIMPPVVKPVVLEDHCFIGVNSVIMPGVTIGRASVVTSGSVVVSSVPEYCMVAGNPAKVIKKFPKPDGTA